MRTLSGYDDRSFNQASYQGQGKRNPFLWWFNLTSIPDPPEDASFVKREVARKSRLISIVAFFLLVLFAIYLPVDIATKSIPSLISTLMILPVALVAIMLNRAGRTFGAGVVVVCFAELALSSVVLTTVPFDITSVQLYGLLVISELLAVSLLPGITVFITAVYNSMVILFSLLYQQQTPVMVQTVHHQFATLLLNPVGVQLLVAGVTYLWVGSTLKAIARADHAEVVASLEHEMGLQATLVAEEKLLLVAKINEVVQFHINTMNSGMSAKFPFSEETKVLWPLINIIHSLQRRVQRSLYTDYELHRLKRAIVDYANYVYATDLAQQEQWPQTKTELDLMLYPIMQQIHKSPLSAWQHTSSIKNGETTASGGSSTTSKRNPVSFGGNPVSFGGESSVTNGMNPVSFGGNPMPPGGNLATSRGNSVPLGGNPRTFGGESSVTNGGNPVSLGGNPVSLGGNPRAFGENSATNGRNPRTFRKNPAEFAESPMFNGSATRKL